MMRWDHPRIRGGYAQGIKINAQGWGSSPHTRGLRAVYPGYLGDLRIIPAHAGFTGRPRSAGTGSSDHPRTRGVYALDPTTVQGGFGSSPHTRGLRGGGHGLGVGDGIIPAHAGFTPGSRAPAGRPTGSSPHTRGLRGHRRRRAAHRRIIPAHAGFTSVRASRRRWRRDHPRTRGVYSWPRHTGRGRRGSSPHTRGLRVTPRCWGVM